MATVASREGVISFTADGDTSPDNGSSRIYTVIIHDTGGGTGTLKKVGPSGPPVFTYNSSAGSTVAGEYWFDLCGCVSTSGGLYWDSTVNTAVDIYVK